jgi:hypothetical protein
MVETGTITVSKEALFVFQAARNRSRGQANWTALLTEMRRKGWI